MTLLSGSEVLRQAFSSTDMEAGPLASVPTSSAAYAINSYWWIHDTQNTIGSSVYILARPTSLAE